MDDLLDFTASADQLGRQLIREHLNNLLQKWCAPAGCLSRNLSEKDALQVKSDLNIMLTECCCHGLIASMSPAR